jgi:hypothetical protein
MTSDSTFPQRLTKIDDLVRPDHFYLSVEDECYFLGEYTARKGFSFSATNQLILNFKKKMDRLGKPEWAYKARAIHTAAAALRASLNDTARNTLTFVPIPPSKAKTDPLYDDRLIQMLHCIWVGQNTAIRELVIQPQTMEAAHDNDVRPSPDELISRYTLDDRLLNPQPQLLAIVDDVLTTGAHFVAVRTVLRRAYPTAKIIGLFIARRVPEAVDFEDFDF